MANEAYDKIVSLTENYNQLSNGKWNGFMDMKPRKLPVFDNPEINISAVVSKEAIGISVEDTLDNFNSVSINCLRFMSTIRMPTLLMFI